MPAERGTSDWLSRSPASVGATLRVVRVKSRTPSRASSCLMVWLSVDCDVPSSAAAFVKLRSRTTARNHNKSFRSSRCMGHLSPRHSYHRSIGLCGLFRLLGRGRQPYLRATARMDLTARGLVPPFPHHAPRTEHMDTTYDGQLVKAPSAWGAVTCLSLLTFVLVASEFMPVSLLTPIANELAISEGQAGQAISVSGFFAVLTSLFGNALLSRLDRRTVVLF